MMILPRILKNYTAYIDGRGMVGRIETAKLPDLDITTEDYRGGGMDTSVPQDMGMAPLTGEIVLAEYDPDIIKLWGLFNASTPIVLRGAIQRQGEDAVAVVVRMTGGFKTIGRAEWKTGSNSPMTLSYIANSYQEIIAGETLVDIDVLNFRRVIGGVDQLASIRSALG